MSGVRILLVHSLKILRESLKALLDAETDLSVVSEASSAAEVVRLAEETRPDVILMEAGMSGPSIIEAARQIVRVSNGKVLFLSSFEDEDLLFECMQAGASGFLSRDTGSVELISAIRQIARGGKYLTAPVLSRFVEGWRVRKRVGDDPISVLTAREREVVKLLAEGRSVKECAVVLNVSAKTVEAHKFNLMRKLNVHNKAQLVHYAYQKKIVRLPLLAS